MGKHNHRKKFPLAIVSLLIGSTLCSCGSPRYRTGHIVGQKPCVISKPIDVQCCLSRKQDKRVGSISAAVGCLTTPFKNLGLFGWTDYGFTAEAIGRVVQARLSTDHLLTVDLQLESLRVEHARISDVSHRFIRLEIYRPSIRIPDNARVFARGKLVWDGDGHLEIHPQKEGDYKECD